MKISNNVSITSIYQEQLKKAKAKTALGEADFGSLIGGAKAKPASSAQKPFSLQGAGSAVNLSLTGKPVKEADPVETMQFAARVVANEPDVRAERVNAIKKLFDAGQYNVSAEAVAEKLLRSGVVTRSWEG